MRVNAVAPGPTESEALAASGLPGGAVDKIKQEETDQIPLGRRGKPEDIVVCGQRHPHPLGVGLPPTGRTLHIGEQKRHQPRRSGGRRSGHPCRISQPTSSYLPHRRNPAQTPAPRCCVDARSRSFLATD